MTRRRIPEEAQVPAGRARKKATTQITGGSPAADVSQTARLLHELQVHQIELELQNEELRATRAEVEAGLDRYTDLYDFAPIGYFTFDRDGSIRELNLTGARLLESERTRLVGARFEAFVAGATRPIFDSWLKRVFATRSNQTCSVSLARDGRSHAVVDLEGHLAPDGLTARAAIVDVTARRNLEDQLRQAQKIQAIGQLAGGVAHDFNNILGAMILNLEMLQNECQLPTDALTPLSNLEGLTRRASSLTQQLLLFGRRETMQTASIELNASLTTLFRMLGVSLGEEIAFVRLGVDQEHWVEADRAMLDQAVTNVCLNARDAMPLGGTLTLETSSVELDPESARFHPEGRPGKFICLRISDTGSGMGTDVLAHAIEPFFTTKAVGKGSGLGLSSTHGIVHQHHGFLHIESVVGKGTSVLFYLPLSTRRVASPRGVPRLSQKPRSATILLVDDEAPLLRISARALTKFGHRVFPASDGPSALKLWESDKDTIDLVITDMRMPNGMSGLVLAEKLRQAKPSLKVIVMSGYAPDMGRFEALADLGYTFLPKPFDLKQLSSAVQKALA